MAWYRLTPLNYGTSVGVGDIAQSYSALTIGTGFSHREGCDCYTTSAYAHAEGYKTSASTAYSHSEGYATIASGTHSHAEGYCTTASGDSSTACGAYCTASGDYSHAHGYSCVASGEASHAHGYGCYATGEGSHAHGLSCSAVTSYSHAEGMGTVSSGLPYSFTCGQYNLSKDDRVLTVGKGSSSSRSNAFSVNTGGSLYFSTSVSDSSADYAEMFEWADGNPYDEDRVGLFVTLCDGEKIRIANSGDTPIGVVSATPSIIGDSDFGWKGKYLKDKYGRIQYSLEDIPLPHTDSEILDDVNDISADTREIEYIQLNVPILNPEYDSGQTYVTRSERSEWDVIGLLGKLRVNDDGSCVVGEKCTVGDNGIATAGNDYYVIERNSDKIITVLGKFL